MTVSYEGAHGQPRETITTTTTHLLLVGAGIACLTAVPAAQKGKKPNTVTPIDEPQTRPVAGLPTSRDDDAGHGGKRIVVHAHVFAQLETRVGR